MPFAIGGQVQSGFLEVSDSPFSQWVVAEIAEIVGWPSLVRDLVGFDADSAEQMLLVVRPVGFVVQ